MFLTRPTLRAPRRTLFPSSPAQPRAILFHPFPATCALPRRAPPYICSLYMLLPNSLVQFSKNSLEQSKRVGVSMLLPSWLVSPLDGVVAMLVLLRTFSPSHPAHVETCALPNDEHRHIGCLISYCALERDI